MRRRIGIAGMILALCLAGCGGNGEQTSPAVTRQEPGSGAMTEGEEEPENAAGMENHEDQQERLSQGQREPGSGEAKPDGGEDSPMLVVYFSQSGNTRQIAEFIVQETGGDLFEIVTAEPYPDVLEELYERGQEELDANARPELAERVENIGDYDTIFLGYPIWGGTCPMAVFSFMEQHDLSGKTVIPFCTHGGSGISGSLPDLESALPGDVRMLEGFSVLGTNAGQSREGVQEWLAGLGLEESGRSGKSAGLPSANDGYGAGSSRLEEQKETAIRIMIGDMVLEGILYDTALAQEIKEYFPLTISAVGYGGREYYGSVSFYPENLEGGQRTFENGEITYCEAHHNMAIFYAQTDHPTLSVDVIPIGRVTSDLAVFDTLEGQEEIRFSLPE